MREKFLLIGVIIATITLFLLPFLITRIKTYMKIRKLMKEFNNLPGILFLSDALDGLSSCASCCSEATEPEMTFEANFEQDEEKRKKALEEYETSKKKMKKTKSIHSSDMEKKLVMDIIRQREKTGIVFISTRTKIPQEKIIEIINENPDYFIENEYVLKKKKLAEVTIREKDVEITKKICPNCDTPIEAGWDHCSNCGVRLK